MFPSFTDAPRLRMVLVAVVLLMAAVACTPRAVVEPAVARHDGGGSVIAPAGPDQPDPAPAPSSASEAAPATEPEPQPEPDTPQQDVAITATGVPVKVVGANEQGSVVKSPCGRDVVVAGLQPLGRVQVVVDPGHGGPIDTGAVGANELREADLNLAVARAFVAELSARGIPAVLTRSGDYAVPIPVRVEFADATDAAMFVSIHHNAPMMDRSAGPGTEVFVQSDSHASERLGGLFQEEIVAELSQFDVAWVGAPDAGALRVEEPDGSESYGIIRLARTPTALVELGYMANPAEAAFFATDAYPGIAATALADAAEAYLVTDRLEGFRAGLRTFTAGHSHASVECADPALVP
jgi:N-acetylmuramoyl-L-alanine amidase